MFLNSSFSFYFGCYFVTAEYSSNENYIYVVEEGGASEIVFGVNINGVKAVIKIDVIS